MLLKVIDIDLRNEKFCKPLVALVNALLENSMDPIQGQNINGILYALIALTLLVSHVKLLNILFSPLKKLQN